MTTAAGAALVPHMVSQRAQRPALPLTEQSECNLSGGAVCTIGKTQHSLSGKAVIDISLLAWTRHM